MGHRYQSRSLPSLHNSILVFSHRPSRTERNPEDQDVVGVVPFSPTTSIIRPLHRPMAVNGSTLFHSPGPRQLFACHHFECDGKKVTASALNRSGNNLMSTLFYDAQHQK